MHPARRWQDAGGPPSVGAPRTWRTHDAQHAVPRPRRVRRTAAAVGSGALTGRLPPGDHGLHAQPGPHHGAHRAVGDLPHPVQARAAPDPQRPGRDRRGVHPRRRPDVHLQAPGRRRQGLREAAGHPCAVGAAGRRRRGPRRGHPTRRRHGDQDRALVGRHGVRHPDAPVRRRRQGRRAAAHPAQGHQGVGDPARGLPGPVLGPRPRPGRPAPGRLALHPRRRAGPRRRGRQPQRRAPGRHGPDPQARRRARGGRLRPVAGRHVRRHDVAGTPRRGRRAHAPGPGGPGSRGERGARRRRGRRPVQAGDLTGRSPGGLPRRAALHAALRAARDPARPAAGRDRPRGRPRDPGRGGLGSLGVGPAVAPRRLRPGGDRGPGRALPGVRGRPRDRHRPAAHRRRLHLLRPPGRTRRKRGLRAAHLLPGAAAPGADRARRQ